MPAINFQERFRESILSGRKIQTIRKYRKTPFKEGDRLYLYTGLRTKNCKKIFEKTIKAVYDFEIKKNGDFYIGTFKVDTLSEFEIARYDGFADKYDMLEWFIKNHGLPFHGQLIRWA